MGNMKKAYWLTKNNDIQRKFPCENLCTWEQTKLKWGKMCQQYYQEKGVLGIGIQALKWI
jgi:predicted transcriptional regulator